LIYLLDKLAEAKYIIALQLDTIKIQDSRLKYQTQSKAVKNLAVATNAESKGPVRRKRKRTEKAYRLGILVENL
jgi:hypothetical protein